MILFDHPIWPHIAKYSHLSEGRDNLDFLALTDQLRELALNVVVNCVACGSPMKCLRSRAKSERSRIGGTEVEHRLFYAPTCPTEVNSGCSRTLAARSHKEIVKSILKKLEPQQVAGSIEVYDALCLQEPWLELILLGAKCMRKTEGEVVLTSSKTVDQQAWDEFVLGGLLDDAAQKRALDGLGKLVGLVHMGGFQTGVPGRDDAAACINMIAPDGRTRFIAAVSNPRRVVRTDTIRVQERDGKIAIVPGASQGFFRVPKSAVVML